MTVGFDGHVHAPPLPFAASTRARISDPQRMGSGSGVKGVVATVYDVGYSPAHSLTHIRLSTEVSEFGAAGRR